MNLYGINRLFYIYNRVREQKWRSCLSNLYYSINGPAKITSVRSFQYIYRNVLCTIAARSDAECDQHLDYFVVDLRRIMSHYVLGS